MSTLFPVSDSTGGAVQILLIAKVNMFSVDVSSIVMTFLLELALQ